MKRGGNWKRRERPTKPPDTAPLLTKEEEIELAKIIEEGKTVIARVLLKTRMITDELNGEWDFGKGFYLL